MSVVDREELGRPSPSVVASPIAAYLNDLLERTALIEEGQVATYIP